MRLVAFSFFAVAALIAGNDVSISEQLEGAYYCVTEAAGGLSYDSSQKAWRGTSFQTDLKFVLRMTFIDRKRYQVPVLDTDGKRCDGKQCPSKLPLDFDRYQAKITKTGTDETVYCDDLSSIGPDPSEPQHKVSVSVNGEVFRCEAEDREFVFNLGIKRFLMADMVGYVFDIPPGFEMPGFTHHTPYVAGGTCTKIE